MNNEGSETKMLKRKVVNLGNSIRSNGFRLLTRNYAALLLLILAFIVILIVYGNDFAILINEALQNESYSHILLFPFLIGFLFYLKKDIIKASISFSSKRKNSGLHYMNEFMGIILVVLALLLYWYGSFTFYPLEYHLLSLPIFLSGMTVLFLDYRAIVMLIFPILFTLFLVPIPATIVYAAGGTLANYNTQISHFLLKSAGIPVTLTSAFGSPVLQLSSNIGNPVDFSIDVPCSGIYSLIAFVMFASFLTFVSSAAAFRKFLAFALGFFIFWILNIVRIAGIVSIAYWFGTEIALFLHSFAGLLIVFIGAILVLILSEKLLKVQIQTGNQISTKCSKCKSYISQLEQFCGNCGRFLNKPNIKFPRNALLKMLIFMIGCSVAVLSLSAPAFAISNNYLELNSNSSPQSNPIFPQIDGYQFSFLYRDTAYEAIAHQDASLMYAYSPSNRSHAVIYVDIGISNSISNLHNWEVCYVTYQTSQGQFPLVEVYGSSEIQLLPDASLIAKYFIFETPQSYTQVTLYWYGKAIFRTDLTTEQKYYRMSLIINTNNVTAIPQYKEQLHIVGGILATALEPLKNQALLSLGIPTLQALLILFGALLTASVGVQYLGEKRKIANNREIFSNFASPEEKLVLQALIDLAKEKKHIKTWDILENIRKKHGGHSMSFEKVLNTLGILEEYGLIRRKIVSVENAPVLIWRA